MNKIFKVALPLLILASGIFFTLAILASSDPTALLKSEVRSAPIVETKVVERISHSVILTSWGELQPKEKTKLSLQVNGRVESVHASFVEGGIIKKGDVIVTIEPDDYLTQVVEAEANLASANSQLIQEKAKAEVAVVQHQQIQLNKNKAISSLGLRKPQLLHAHATVKSAQAKLQQSKRNLQRTKLIAPYDALVVKRDIGLGQLASSGEKLGEIYNIENAEIKLPIPQFELGFLPNKVNGIKAKISVNGDKRNAVIARELGLVSNQTRTNHLIAIVDDPYSVRGKVDTLKFGQYVKVSVQAKTLENVFLLSQDDVNNSKVWLLIDNQLQQKLVDIVRTEGKSLYVKGLKEGDVLVTKLPEYPQNGMQVRVKPKLIDYAVANSVRNY